MVHRRSIVTIAAAVVIALSSADVAPAEVPLVLYGGWENVDGTYPTWVEASAAIGPAGRLDGALFHPDYAADLQAFLDSEAVPGEDCLAYGEFYGDEINPPDRSSPAKLTRTSESILVGVVTAKAYGFQLTVPGQMLEVEVTSSAPAGRARERVLAFVPIGRFEVAGRTICKTDSNWTPPPPVGGRVALFLPDPPSVANAYVDLRFPSSFATISEGELALSREVLPETAARPGSAARPGRELRAPASLFDAAIRNRFGSALQW